MTHAGGRPKLYTKELGEEICSAITCTSKSLAKLCKQNPHWPSHETIYSWLRTKSEFSDLYARAKQEQIQYLIDEILDISDDDLHDTIIDDGGKMRQNGEWIARSRLRVDTRKWLASKLVPKLYGMNKIEIGAEESLLEKIVDKL
jgi:hypothetical protein